MSSRLPIPGSDQGTWGQILNDFLSNAHNSDGSLKNQVVTQDSLSAGVATPGQILASNGTQLVWTSPTTVADATTSTKGVVQLTGDLAGTAASPTVPGLATKANTVHTHAITDVTGLQTALNNKADSSALSNYALTSSLSNYALTSSLANYALTSSLSNYALTSSLATVAQSGSYNDLSNKPSIPPIIVSSVAPSSPSVGDMWVDLSA